MFERIPGAWYGQGEDKREKQGLTKFTARRDQRVSLRVRLHHLLGTRRDSLRRRVTRLRPKD